jgi:prophage antirepressor-like protein
MSKSNKKQVLKLYMSKNDTVKEKANETSEDNSLEDEDKPAKMIEKVIKNDIQIIKNDGFISKIFTYEECDILVIRDEKGEYWYKAKQIATILEYTDTKGAVARHVDNEYKKSYADIWRGNQATINLDPKTIFIDDSGFMQLVARSKKKECVKLWRKITKEILPTLFRTGHYEMPITETDIEKLNKNFYDTNKLSDFMGNPCVYCAYVGQHKIIIDGITRTEHVIKYGETTKMDERDLDQHRKFYKKFNMLKIWKSLAFKKVEKNIEKNLKSLNILVDLKIKGNNKTKEENKKEHFILTQKYNLEHCLNMIEDVVKNTTLPQEEEYKKKIDCLEYEKKLITEKYKHAIESIQYLKESNKYLKESNQQLKDNLNDLRKNNNDKNNKKSNKVI